MNKSGEREFDPPSTARTGSKSKGHMDAYRKVVDRGLSFAYDGYHQIAASGTKLAQWLSIYRDIDSDALGLFAVPVDRGCDKFVDSDNDGIPDWFEWLAINYLQDDNVTSLADIDGLSDVDGDGWKLGEELQWGGEANLFDMKDTDEDGLIDILERKLGYDPYKYDTDGDGMSDGWEHQFKSPNISPLVWNDPNGDADLDANGNVVGDGVSNIHEFFYKTNPNKIDSDGDGYNDDVEIAQGTDPNDPNDTPDPNNPKPVWKLTLGVGDESSSNSEHYKLVFYKINEHGELLESNRMDFSYEAPGPGQYSGPEEFTLPETEHGIFVVLWWIKSNNSNPDFDYTVVCEKYEGDFFVFDPDGVIDQVTGNESGNKSWSEGHYPPNTPAHSGVTQADVRSGHRIAILPIKIVPDDGDETIASDDMVGVVGDMIPSINTIQPEYHFVTPKETSEIP